jgi:hypothetical protein
MEEERMRRRISVLAALSLLGGLLLGAPVAIAQEPPEVGSATVHHKQITGPPAERMNLVILGDGYTWQESAKFHEDVDRNLGVLWSIEPYRSYRNYMNVYLIEIVSGESGVRCDPDEEGGPDPDKLTPLRLIFSQGCVDPLARGTVYNNDTSPGSNDPGGPGTALAPGTTTGNQQHAFYMSTYMTPLGVSGQNVQTLAIFNTFTYGGIGGTQATTSGGSPQGPLISVHELGHSHGQMADEYPYSSRPTPGGAAPNTEPSSFHHSRMTHAQMVATQSKWWRWLCEKSESGGYITARDSPPDCGPPHEGGNLRSSNVWRPSEHSIMRWIGNHFDQVGREHMVGRVSGRRNANAMVILSTPQGQVGPNDVLWVETQHPKFHELDVTWRIGGANGDVIPDTNNSRNLELGPLALEEGTIIHVTVKDPTDFIRDPALANGPRFTQTRSWIIGTPLTPNEVDVKFSFATPNNAAVAANEIVWVEPTHPTDRVLDVTWRLNGDVLPNPNNLRNLDLESLDLPTGTHGLSATVTDPADPANPGQTVEWMVDNVLPTIPRQLSAPLTTLDGDVEHNVYFNEFTMKLEPQDAQPGAVVGEFRLNEDGWFNYFGFPEQPFGTPFKFHWKGTDVKALTYGNLGSGGLSKATWEQNLPQFGFEPGFGTHKVEQRALDFAGNYGGVSEFKATVLPGGSPACTTTVSGTRNSRLNVNSGVTCIVNGTMNGGVTVRNGGSVVVADGSTIHGGLTATGAGAVHLFGVQVFGDATISTTADVSIANTSFQGNLTLANNQGRVIDVMPTVTRNYGVVLVGNRVNETLSCTGSDPGVTNFDVPNTVIGTASGQCAGL